jgi:hypothetical protein
MKRHLLSLTVAGLSTVALALPAAARPEIASGDQLLETDVAGCLATADQFIGNLGVDSSEGMMDRTGYFEDGAFRILCYGAGESSSLAVVFATHNSSSEVALDFIQLALDEMVQGLAVSEQTLPAPTK